MAQKLQGKRVVRGDLTVLRSGRLCEAVGSCQSPPWAPFLPHVQPLRTLYRDGASETLLSPQCVRTAVVCQHVRIPRTASCSDYLPVPAAAMKHAWDVTS